MKLFGWLGKRRSVRRELVLWNALALIALFAGLGAVTRWLVESYMIGSIDRELTGRVEGFAQERAMLIAERPFAIQRMRGERREVPRREMFPTWFDLTGKPVLGGGFGPWDLKGFEAAKTGQVRHGSVVADGQDVRVVSYPLVSEGKVQGVVQNAYPLTEVNRVLGSLNLVFLAMAPVALLLSILGSVFVTGRVLRRFHGLTRTVGGLRAENLDERLPVEGGDEFSELASTFNGMLERVKAAFDEQKRLLEQQRRFTGDASHELRTPLTVIKGSASLALESSPAVQDLRRAMAEIDRSADSMTRLVDDLLLLARSDGGQLGRNAIDLMIREVLVAAIASVSPIRPDVPISLDVDDPSLLVRGNEFELSRVFTNLLDNAVRYGKHVCVEASSANGTVSVAVRDDGPGIAAEHLPHLGERFYRVEESRTSGTGGTGLGLSICRSILEGHGGSMTFESVLGQGTTVTVVLPAVT